MKRYLSLFILVIAVSGQLSAQQKTAVTDSFFEPGTGVDNCAHTLRSSAILLPDEVDAASGYDVRFMRMELSVDPAELYISGKISTTIQARTDISEVRMQLITDFDVSSVLYQGSAVQFVHQAPWDLIITLPAVLATGSRATLEVTYLGVPSTAQGFGSVGIGEHEGIPAFWTLSEPYGARDWWPGKNDLTDKIDSTEIIINTPEEYRAASNGLLMLDTVVSGTRTNVWKHNYPVVPYLVAVAVTNYAVYTDTTYSLGTMVPVLNYVYPEDLEEIMARTEQTVPLMELFSELFIKYPFAEEKYGHAQFGWGGGMEHQTMSFMGRFDFEIIAHELAHQWFGDMVTLNSWHDIWLNEGFATYLSGLAYEHMFDGYYWPRWKQLTVNNIVALPGGSVYVADTVNINRIFDSRLSYRKGAYLLHSLRWVVGDSAFFAACINYLNDPLAKYGFASTDMLKSHMEASSGKDLIEYFNDWYYGQGYPSYVLTVNSMEDQKFNVQLTQTTSHPSVDFFEMPVPVTFYGQGKDTTFVFDHQNNQQTWIVDPGFSPDSIKLDPDLWIISANNQVLLDSTEPLPYPGIRIFPNPTRDFIRITTNDRNADLSITDLKGSTVIAKKNFNQFEWIDVRGLKQGVYIIRMTGADFSVEERFIKL